MEVVGFVAATLQLSEVAIKSAIFICQLIRGLRDAPTVLKVLGSQVHQLQGILVRINTLCQRAGQLVDPNTVQVYSQLESPIRKCSYDLQCIRDSLNGFKNAGFWARLRAVAEKEFDLARRTTADHLLELNFIFSEISG